MKTHTTEEVKELQAWFEAQELPKDMQLDKATYIPDLQETVTYLFDQAYICCENPRMQGCILLLEKIKGMLEKR